MAENTMGKLLPNLKITLGNDVDSDDQIEEGELSDTIDDLENIPKNQGEERKVDMIRTWKKTLSEPKVYKNKDGAFITGLDLSDPVVMKKFEERSIRFGLEGKEKKPVTQKEIDALYKSLGIDPESINSCKLKNIRLEALHMHGVEEMDTADVFAYFKDYGPASVEWINDRSCNVLWLDATTTARAIIGVTLAVIKRKERTSEQGITESLTKEDEVKFFDEEIIEMSDLEEGEFKDKKEVDEEFENAMEVDSLSDSEKPDDSETKNYASEVPAEIVDVPVPPGYWRLGVPHPKSKAILLRFATKGDKKLPGAEKRSQYYQKYGNPNYGGLKGLISSSRKRKMQAARNRQVVEKFTEDSKSHPKIDSGETSKRTVVKSNRNKMPRMRMYADDEEERKRKDTFMRHESGRRSVHSRLGTKYTKEDLFQLGNRFSSESEEEDDNISINCTVPPSRFNIWTDLAKSMAKEDNYRARSISPDTKPFDLRNSRNNRATRDRSFARDRRSPESRSFPRDRRSPESRSFARDRRSPESIRGSRPWRPSRDESSQDLRSSLNSQRHQSPLNRPQEDLRSKIKRIKKEDSVNKHRSPMFMDD